MGVVEAVAVMEGETAAVALTGIVTAALTQTRLASDVEMKQDQDPVSA